MPATYREQYDRMKRWWERFDNLDKGRSHDAVSDSYVDEIYAFFINCYHVKDWIQQDTGVAQSIRCSVEGYIKQNRSLKLCGDICNALKHLVLTRKPKSGEEPVFGKKQYGLHLGPEPATITLKYEVNTTNGPLDAFQLSTDCVKAWDTFLQSNGLL